MKTIAVNSDIDIYLDTSGNLAIAYNLEAVIQGCEQAARILKGELPYAQTTGTPFFDNPLTVSPNLIIFEADLRKAYTSVNGVTGVSFVRFRFEGDVLYYEAGINSIYGEAVINANV